MGDKAKVLIIDDEEGIRFSFERFLSKEGYDVTTAGHYDEALAAIAQKEFDLIVADIILGGKTGLDFVREARARGIKCPVVIITGDPTSESATDAFKITGVFDYLSKPVKKEKILEVTRAALSNK